MISVGFFGCKKEQIVSCSWEEACDRFPCTGITLPDVSALISFSEALTGSRIFSAELLPSSTERFYEFPPHLETAVREASAEDLMDAGARWACLPPWNSLATNGMDLAGFLLDLQLLVSGEGRVGNSIFVFVEPDDPPSI